ncbi:Ulp1 family isopeptidase, partial [Xanthomonas campestris pv. campestris]|nr:Ulp1 family isopeptidase [Xanthomonas campestris pv. campestris]
DYKNYLEMTEAADDHRNSPPPEEHRENYSTGYNMHPLLESLPRRNPTQVPADSSVHQMRAAAPTSNRHRSYSRLLDLSGAYGDGKKMSELLRSFPTFDFYLKTDGLSHRAGMQMLRELSGDQCDHVIGQIIRRVENCLGPAKREIALSNLELDCSQNIVLSQLTLDRIAKAKAKVKGKAKAKAEAEAKAEVAVAVEVAAKFAAEDAATAAAAAAAQSVISKIIEHLPIYETLQKLPRHAEGVSGFQNYLCKNGSFGQALINILEYATPDQKERLKQAIQKRRQALAAHNAVAATKSNVPRTGVFRTLYKNPKLILGISGKLSKRTCSINDASSGYLSQADLEKIVDEKTGELTPLGEEVISGASESIQDAIRANFRMRYQQPELPPNSPPQAFYPQEENPPPSSFFQGVSSYWRHVGCEPEPDTPQYPPQSPASTFSGLSSMSHYGREFDLNTPQQIEQPGWQGATPAQSTDSTFGGLSSMSHYGREFDLNTPQQIEQPGWQGATPAQSTDSTFDCLSSMSHYGREFDLNTPREEQLWSTDGDYGTQAPVGRSATPAMSPERIDVDNLPSPQDVPDSELPPATATSWLLDGHLRAYTDDLARRLRGQPNAHLLHFADSQVVTMLSSTDPDQQARARRLLVGDDVPPIVFLPINQRDTHWSLLVVDRRNKDAVATYHYDSMAQMQQQQRYLGQMAVYHLDLDYQQIHEMPTAIQRDGYSCGDHVLTGIEMLAHRVIDGTFDDADGRDLRGITPDRGLIRGRLAQAEQAPAESSVRQAPELPIEQKKKKSKWWKFQ